MNEVIKVNEEIVADIQLKQMKYETERQIVKEFLTEHQLDRDDKALSSPIFATFQESMVADKLAWEQAKDAMVMQYIPEDKQSKVKSWNLSYGTNELTVTY